MFPGFFQKFHLAHFPGNLIQRNLQRVCSYIHEELDELHSSEMLPNYSHVNAFYGFIVIISRTYFLFNFNLMKNRRTLLTITKQIGACDRARGSFCVEKKKNTGFRRCISSVFPSFAFIASMDADDETEHSRVNNDVASRQKKFNSNGTMYV